jgi:hypothetical protein
MAARLPGIDEDAAGAMPALRVRKKLLTWLKEDGDTVALKVDPIDRDVLLQIDPKAFYLTNHYRSSPIVLVRLSQARPEVFGELFERAWRRYASKRMVAAAAATDAPPRRTRGRPRAKR